MNDEDVRDYCFLRLPEDSPQFAELHEEFIRDPVNSRVGRFCQETERVVRRVSDGELDWEVMLHEWDATASDDVSDGIEADCGSKMGDSAQAFDSRIVDSVIDSAAHFSTVASNAVRADHATTSRKWWNARSTTVTIGIVAASVLLLSLGFNGWLIRARSIERDRLGSALSVLEMSATQGNVGSQDVRKALADVEQSLGRNHPVYKEGMRNLYFVLSNQEQNNEAAMKVALEMAATSSDGGKAYWLTYAAKDARRAGNIVRSRQLLMEVANSSDSTYSSFAWDSLSQLEHKAGNLKDAIKFRKNAVERAVDEDLWKCDTMLTLAKLYVESEQWALAEEVITDTIELNNRTGGGVGPTHYEILALAAYHQNEPMKELVARQRLVASADKYGGPRDSRYALSITQLADVEFRTGDIRAAERESRRAIDEFERIGKTDSAEYAEALVLEARLANHFGKYVEARPKAARAVEILDRSGKNSRQCWFLSEAYGELAEAQLNLGDLVSAETSALTGLELSREINDPEQLAARWLNLSAVSVAGGRFGEAQNRIEEAETNSPASFVLTRQSLLASALAGLGQTREAAAILDMALRGTVNLNERVVLEFQLAGLLARIPERKVEGAGLLAKNKLALAEHFPERAITSTDVATVLRTVEPQNRQPQLLLFPKNSESGNPYFG